MKSFTFFQHKKSALFIEGVRVIQVIVQQGVVIAESP